MTNRNLLTMPIPTRNEGENRQEFLDRCITDPTMVSEYSQDQREAICLREANKREEHYKLYKQISDKRKGYISWATRKVSKNFDEKLEPIDPNNVEATYPIGKTQQLFIDIYQTVVPDFAQDSFERLNTSKAKADNNWKEIAKDFAQTQLGELIQNIEDTDLHLLRQIVKQAISDGIGVNKLEQYLRSNWRAMTRWRSLTIARTEVMRASNYATVKGAEKIPFEKEKIWIATLDDLVRSDHASAHDQRRDVGQDFDVGGDELSYPHDPKGSAKQTINCRCTLTHRLKKLE